MSHIICHIFVVVWAEYNGEEKSKRLIDGERQKKVELENISNKIMIKGMLNVKLLMIIML